MRDAIAAKLIDLRDNPNRMETPAIYHLDVGAMYPNIILTNRLQPPSIVSEVTLTLTLTFSLSLSLRLSPNLSLSPSLSLSLPLKATCAACVHNRPESDCKRPLEWMWRGEIYPASLGEAAMIKNTLQVRPHSAL